MVLGGYLWHLVGQRDVRKSISGTAFLWENEIFSGARDGKGKPYFSKMNIDKIDC